MNRSAATSAVGRRGAHKQRQRRRAAGAAGGQAGTIRLTSRADDPRDRASERLLNTAPDDAERAALLGPAPAPAEERERAGLAREERDLELAGEERRLGHETPVDRPRVQERAREVERRSQVRRRVVLGREEERRGEGELRERAEGSTRSATREAACARAKGRRTWTRAMSARLTSILTGPTAFQ